MIRVHNKEYNFAYRIDPTTFPDGTSQIWKIHGDIFSFNNVTIDWRFEEEREFFDILNLSYLLSSRGIQMSLHVPYFPYARQDKDVSNDATFALYPFCHLLHRLPFVKISAFDIHNPKKSFGVHNISAGPIITRLWDNLQYEVVVFPDKGAAERYKFVRELPIKEIVVCDKRRDPESGFIIGQTIPDIQLTTGKVIVIDDICDGGATFVGLGRQLKQKYPQIELHLYVSHGIFSKGKQCLYDAGYDFIHTTNSLPRNKEGIPV